MSIDDGTALQAGDVLLVKSTGELAKVIAWFGDSTYSHAAIMVAPDRVVEARVSGVVECGIDELRAPKDIAWTDVYRPLAAEGTALSAADRALVAAKARTFVGQAYPLDDLAWLGVLVALREKWPDSLRAKWLVRIAVDHLVRVEPGHVTCSELVYRAFLECEAMPRGRLALRIEPVARGTMPFPKVDWFSLAGEIRDLFTHKGTDLVLASGVDLAADPDDLPPIDEADLRARIGTARDHVLGPAMAKSTTSATGRPTNPRAVSPQDLADARPRGPIRTLYRNPRFPRAAVMEAADV